MPSASRAGEPPKTYVLVHGAYHGGWCWQPVAERLRERGHRVYTPTMTGLGERAHLLATQPTLETFVGDVLALIGQEQLDDIILVGHSFGGGTVIGVTDRMPERIRHMVLLDAMILQPDTAPLDQVVPEAFEKLRALAGPDGGIPAPPPEYFGVTDPGQAQWLVRHLTPHPLSTFRSALRLSQAPGAGRPVTYITCTEPYFRDTEAYRRYAQARSDWQLLDIATGHDAMVSAPDALAQLLATID